MKCIVGLGNPNKKYEHSRHNAGFLVLDRLAEELNCSWKNDKYLFSKIAKCSDNKQDVLLVKPQTYMNNSGQALSTVVAFYKIKTPDILIVHDDMDLPLGGFAYMQGGGTAGHNGIKSIYEHLGHKPLARLRIGIGRPETKLSDLASWVISPMDKDSLKAFNSILLELTDSILFWLQNSTEKSMNKYNVFKKGK